MSVKILILSDIHLSHQHFSAVHEGQRIDANADVIVLAGDLTEGSGGFRWARKEFPDKAILAVAGNHEFYGAHFFHHLDVLREVANKYDVDFLEVDGIDIGGIRFLGTSLWTDFELFGADRKLAAMANAKATMNDFLEIKISRTPELHHIKGIRLTPELTALRHKASVEWLEGKLKKGDPAKTVIITHFAPHPKSIPSHFKNDLLSAAYASDLTRLMGKAALWIHGHIHSSANYVVSGTRIVANPRGYLNKHGSLENANFDPFFTVEI